MVEISKEEITPSSNDEDGEVLEAEHLYILMKKDYRISRNIRAEWYLKRINTIITVPRKDKLSEYTEELEVVSVIPHDVPQDWDSDISHLYKYRITERTTLHFLARKYRLVFCLDLSPSVSVVDSQKGEVVLDEVFTTLKTTLKGIVRPFYVPGSQLLFQPKVYITIVAHTPFFKSQCQQVLIQGWLLIPHDLESFLHSIYVKLTTLEEQVAKATAQTYRELELLRERSELVQQKVTGDLFDETIDMTPATVTNPMVSPDIGFVNMLRYGIVSLQLLPENSIAGIVVITDGVISLPDATMFDSLLVQLRNQTIACSFLQLGSVYHPQAGLGFVPFTDLMHFMATATCGAYLTSLPTIEENYVYDMNDYHKALLAWSFQKFLGTLSSDEILYGMSTFLDYLPIASQTSELMRKKERENPLQTSLTSILSCRLREGYTIKQVKIQEDQIQLILVLPWKYSIFIEYHIKAAWPPLNNLVHTQLWIEATYEFLNDVTNDANKEFQSKYRQRMVAKYWGTLQHLKETDLLLVSLQSFATNPAYYIIPDCIKSGAPLFYQTSGSVNPLPTRGTVAFPHFANFWKPVCLLDTNIWQKWMHTHRIGIILVHDHPLPKNLHTVNTSGRYGVVQCRQAELALTTLLAEWSDFVLIEKHSYIKFLYKDNETPPYSFFVVRITSKPAPCLVIRLAFLGGTPGHIRNQSVSELRDKIKTLTFPSRAGLKDRTNTLASMEMLEKGAEVEGPPSQEHSRLAPKSSHIPCCVITHKPIEKILFWYEKIPTNLLSSIVQEPPVSPPAKTSLYTKVGATNKSASNNTALLSRYLHHRRWVWDVQMPGATPVSSCVLARILKTLTDMRLVEGFNFAHCSSGIITMVMELDMKLELNCGKGTEGLVDACFKAGEETFPCVAQYVLFPPHHASPKDGVSDDWDESDSGEADGDLQLITECWVEPQNGVVASCSSNAQHLCGLNYQELGQAFFPLDQECIWGLLTFEYLVLLCQAPWDSRSNFISPEQVPRGVDDIPHRIQEVPFALDIPKLLPKCQQAELLVSTYIQDLMGSLVKRVTFNMTSSVDDANQILYSLFVEQLSKLHGGHEFPLTSAVNYSLPQLLLQRKRKQKLPPSPFLNTPTNVKGDPPKWRCFIKYVSHTQVILTLLPATYSDLKLLLVKRANITSPENSAVKLVSLADTLLESDTETNQELEVPGPGGATSSEAHLSMESSCSSLPITSSPATGTHMCSATPSNERMQRFNGPDASDVFLPSAVRHRSGPAPHTHHVSHHCVPDGSVRERASSFNVCRERSCSFETAAEAAERNRTGSVDSPTKDPSYSSPKERVRKRYTSMPAKAHTGTTLSTTMSLSTDALKVEESCIPLHIRQEQNTSTPSVDPSSDLSTPSSHHKPMYGAVSLPIYMYDCQLPAITTQLIHREEQEKAVLKDMYIDSTFRHDLILNENDFSKKKSMSVEDSVKEEMTEMKTEDSGCGTQDYLLNHVKAVEVCHLRSFVEGVFQALQNEQVIHAHDVQTAMDHCSETVMEIDITHFLQTVCGHLKDYGLKSKMDQRRLQHSVQTHDVTEECDMGFIEEEFMQDANIFPLSLVKLHQPCNDLRTLHSNIKEHFMNILQESFKSVPSFPEYYFYFPQGSTIYDGSVSMNKNCKLRRMYQVKKSYMQVYDDDDNDDDKTMNGKDEDDLFEDEEDEDHDKSIEFSSEFGSVYRRCNSQQTAAFGDDDKTSIISKGDEDLSTVSDNIEIAEGPSPPLFLHFTCTVRSKGSVQRSVTVKTVPTCLGEILDCFSEEKIDLPSMSMTLDVLCMVLPPNFPCGIQNVPIERERTTSSNSTGSVQPQRRLSNASSTSGMEIDNEYIGGMDQLSHLPSYQHQSVITAVDDVKWLLRDEIASSLLQAYPLTEQILEMVAAHVESSSNAGNCIYEPIGLHFVCGAEKSMEQFVQEFNKMKLNGHHLEKENGFYYLVQDKSQGRRHCSSLVPPLGIKALYPIIRHPGDISKDSGRDGEESKAPVNGAVSTRKLQSRVSFEKPGRKETSNTVSEVVEKEKWARRRERKERRDSERRGSVESTDSDSDELRMRSCFLRDSSQGSSEMGQRKTSEETRGYFTGSPVEGNEIDVTIKHKSVANSSDANEKLLKMIQSSVNMDPNNEKELQTVDVNINISKSVNESKLCEEIKEGGNRDSSNECNLLTETLLQKATEILEGETSREKLTLLMPLPQSELVRCGSESLPKTQGSADVLRKSASSDNFSPTDAPQDALVKPTHPINSNAGSGLWETLIKSRHNSSELMKGSHNSSVTVEALKSRHSSESGQTTEDGHEGDISDSDNDCCEWLQEFKAIRPLLPDFWLILRIGSERVDTFFHCRCQAELKERHSLQKEMVNKIKSLIKTVNQRMLLEDLHATNMCSRLLEPETSDDIWKHEETSMMPSLSRGKLSEDSEYQDYLPATKKFKPGAFACPVVWETKFDLHPKVKLVAGKGVTKGAQGHSKGMQALRTVMDHMAVHKRKNMFVYEDSSGKGTNVFYLRLKEHQFSLPSHDLRRDDSGLSRSSSIISLGKRGSRDEEPVLLQGEHRPRVSSFGEKDVIMEGIPSTSGQRKCNDCIVLTAHGIAEPGPAIKEELVHMLQNRLDEAVLDSICLMLWHNPQHKLTPDDVYFIQPPCQPPSSVLRYTVNAHAFSYLQAVGFYIRQNMLTCGFIHPKYADNRPEHHFQDFSSTDQDVCSDPNIFLFVRPQKSGAKGIACIAFSLVDGSGNVVQHFSCPRPSPLAYQEVFTKVDFGNLTQTNIFQPSPTKSPGPMAVLQFKVWVSGIVAVDEISEKIMEATMHALWDVTTEYKVLTAPVNSSSHPPTAVSEPSTPRKDGHGHPVRSISLLEHVQHQAEDRTRSVSVSGVPPHVCLPRWGLKLGTKHSRTADLSKEGQKDRAPSPHTLFQARHGLLPTSVTDAKLQKRRASLQVPLDVIMSAHADSQPLISHSPKKTRHSVDLSVERRDAASEDRWKDSDSSLPEGKGRDRHESENQQLNPVFYDVLLDWFEYALKIGVHSVKKHAIQVTSRHALPVFVQELQKWMTLNTPYKNVKVFMESSLDSATSYNFLEPGKIPQYIKMSSEMEPELGNLIIVGRNNQQWWATLYDDVFQDYYSPSSKSGGKDFQHFPPFIQWPRGTRGAEGGFLRSDSGGLSTPSTVQVPQVSTGAVGGTTAAPIAVPSTPTSVSSGLTNMWSADPSELVFIPRQTLFLAIVRDQHLTVYTYNWMKERYDSLNNTVTQLSQWTIARSSLLSSIILQKLGLFHNLPFTRKEQEKKDEGGNQFTQNITIIDHLIKNHSVPTSQSDRNERGSRRVLLIASTRDFGDAFRDHRPSRPMHKSHAFSINDIVSKHGMQMLEIRKATVQRENQKKILLQTMVQTPGHSSPIFNEKIFDLYRQNARLVHFCYTPLLFLPRWRRQVAATRDYTLSDLSSVNDNVPMCIPKTPEVRSRHGSGSSSKGFNPVSGIVGAHDYRRALPMLSSPNQRKRHVTGGDDKWHDALCSSYLKEYVQYLQSLGFMTLTLNHAHNVKGRHSQVQKTDRNLMKDLHFYENVTSTPSYLLKNVLGGTLLLEIAFSEPYFYTRVFILESVRLQTNRHIAHSSQTISGPSVLGPLTSLAPGHPVLAEGLLPLHCALQDESQFEEKFAVNFFLDECDNVKILLHMHSFTYDYHLRAICSYVADRQLLFTPGYHLSSCLSDFIKYYNKGPNFARNMIHSGELTVDDTWTPGEQLYNYLLAREKQYNMKVLRMTPIVIDPTADMYTEFVLVHTETCPIHYKDANEQKMSDEYDVTLLVSHDASAAANGPESQSHILHLKFYVILTSRRELFPNSNVEKKMGNFKMVSLAKNVDQTNSSNNHTGSNDGEYEDKDDVSNGASSRDTSSSRDSLLPVQSYIGIRLESVNYLAYYSLYEEIMQTTLLKQANAARSRILHIIDQAKIHCRRDLLWQKIPRDQAGSGLTFGEFSELLKLVNRQVLSSMDDQLLPLLSKPLQWYQSLARVLQAKYHDRHRNLTSSDGNVQHTIVMNSKCSDAFMMLSINLHLQKAELCCVIKQAEGEGNDLSVGSTRAFLQDFINACCFHLWSGLL
ncbi:KICSTOR complex protein SZT2-like isoform X3 [Oratosquilla oratoria]|uniref:KICSTOR complex protein SZT2-like isoform X3 n=1 Tax=Oratosquilla oratoria TaxID=337810 RepID=UPI003F76E7C9